MARYAVGDLQGCFTPLRHLLDRVRFDPARDQLWSVGDVVNRGPQSLECLRFVVGLGPAVRVVLGNHDLHLLAVAEGIEPFKRSDTFQDILEAPDRDELLGWLRRQPLLYRDPCGDYAMVHAGLAPQWTLEQAQALADEVAAVLRGDGFREYLRGMYGNEPDCWDETLTGVTRWRVITNYLTRLRFCTRRGAMDLHSKEGPGTAPAGFMPWFDVPERRSAGRALIFGHWAALLGRAQRDDVFALDTGCVWGGHLTLFNLDTREYFRCECTT